MQKKSTSSVTPAFGSRILTPDQDVWSHNAWDHAPPPADQHSTIASALARQRAAPVPAADAAALNSKPAKHWDNFYKANADNFFKDRKWLHLEFPELVAALDESAGEKTVVEFGCGVGNAILPLLADNKNPRLRVRAYDYSSHAIKLVQRSPLYSSSSTTPPVDLIAAVHDLTSPAPPPHLEPNTADIVLLVFVLSALHPAEWRAALATVYKALKPGGLVLMRDYGRHDLTQLRFKSNRLIEENLYVRGDKTRVYFFELDELALLFTGERAKTVDVDVHEETHLDDDPGAESTASTATPPPLDGSTPSDESDLTLDGLRISSDPSRSSPANDTPAADSTPAAEVLTANTPAADSTPADTTPHIHPSLLTLHAPDSDSGLPPHPLFTAVQLGVDRRLLVNRKRQLKMYRVWMQGKFQKL